MPELAEVEFFRRRWWEAGARQIVCEASVQARSRVYRNLETEFAGGADALPVALYGTRLTDSTTHGKQMWFVFKYTKSKTKLWLGIHLGMTGSLRVEPPDYDEQKHDALILKFAKRTLVFNDPRQFGRVRMWVGPASERPRWLQNLPNEVISKNFTAEFVQGVLKRHARAPLKAVLLEQKYFPGIGNWMADEILWRAALHPALLAGSAAAAKISTRLYATIQEVTRDALRVVAGKGRALPSDMNVNIPADWLFNHRWRDGGKCPRTGKLLQRAEIGGRTTCWSPARQKLR